MENINEVMVNSLQKEIEILKEERNRLLEYVKQTNQNDNLLNYINKIEDRNSYVRQIAKYEINKKLTKK